LVGDGGWGGAGMAGGGLMGYPRVLGLGAERRGGAGKGGEGGKVHTACAKQARNGITSWAKPLETTLHPNTAHHSNTRPSHTPRLHIPHITAHRNTKHAIYPTHTHTSVGGGGLLGLDSAPSPSVPKDTRHTHNFNTPSKTLKPLSKHSLTRPLAAKPTQHNTL
jgi:hypothetical protein